MGRMFISYSTKDMVFAKRIAQELSAWNYSYWMAPDMIPAGSSYAKEIPQAIESAQAFILILSANSMNSIWVEKELDHALSHRVRVFPIQLDQAPISSTFQFYLSNVQMISYKRELSEQLIDLKGQIDAVFAPNVQAAPVPAGTMPGGKIKPGSRGGLRSTNSLRINHIPVTCEKCRGSFLKNTKLGTYTCLTCGYENYDDFQKIRNYLGVVGKAPASVIEQETGVSRSTIEALFREEFLEIPQQSEVRVSCKSCGAPIRSGEYCDSCKSRALNQTGGTPTQKGDIWHSLLRK
ncbi:MAG: TIR domain-containing protein [Lachnospiraceae bacterium]|nr:TIR domain-containing protein [Lachnospiraceae bacterium]